LWDRGLPWIEKSAWFKNGLFWVTQTIRILPPGKGGFDQGCSTLSIEFQG
jgi:hypothetical protein